MYPDLYLSTEYKSNLWKNDPRFTEHTKIQEEAKQCYRTGDIQGEKYKKYQNWTPILEDSNETCSELREHFHPAVVKNNRLFRINTIGTNICETSFIWRPIEEELANVSLVGRFITFHTTAYYQCFVPTIQEVLTQLPQSITELSGNFYFTTEAIDRTNPYPYTIGCNMQYHVAVTSVYRA